MATRLVNSWPLSIPPRPVVGRLRRKGLARWRADGWGSLKRTQPGGPCSFFPILLQSSLAMF